MYLIRYGGEFLHDPLSDDRRVSGGTLSGDADDVPELSFTVPPSNPLLGSIAKRDLANLTGRNIKTIDRCLAGLRRDGLVEVEMRFSESGAQLANWYRLRLPAAPNE